MLNMNTAANVFLEISQNFEIKMLKIVKFHERTPLDECFWWGNTENNFW